MEPIAMIVPPELQDSPRTTTPESSTSSSAGGDSGDRRTSTSSSDTSADETFGEADGVGEVGYSAPVASAEAEVVVLKGWESKVINGRLDNLCKAPKTLPAGFRFRAVLHHEVADGAAIVKGYKKLEEMVRRYQIPRTILIRAGTPNERACSVSRTGWVPVYVDHFDVGLRFPLPRLIFDVLAEYELALSQLTPNSIKFIIGFMLLCERLGTLAKAVVFRSLFLCRLCPSTSGMRWYYISGREKMMIFTNIRNKVTRWKRQFVFVRDTRTERINNELAARLSEWRTPNAYMNYPQLTVGDVDLKNRLLDHVKARGLVDLEALVTLEQIALLGFVDVANLHGEAYWKGSVNELKARGTRELGPVPNVKPALTSGRLLHRGRSSSHRSSSSAPRPCAEQRVETTPSSSRRRAREDSDAEDDIPLIRRRTSMGSQLTPAVAVRPANVLPMPAREGMQSFVPPADRQRAKEHVQQHGGHAALIKLMDGGRVQNHELQQSCKQLASEKASLADEVSRLQSSEMANRAASAESRADELARKVNELREELERAQAKKESGIQVAKEEAGRAEDRAKKAESDRERTLHELNALKERVSKADLHVARAEASLEKTKRLHQRDIYFARAQGVEWLVLRHQADFPIGELAFFKDKEINEEGKSLTQPADTRVRLKWELNEEGLPVWPPSVIEEGEDTEGLPSFDAWVADPKDVPVEPSNTPPSAQPTSAAALTLSPPDWSSPARFATACTDTSIPVDLTND
ncbi:hypothetical protein SLEP1_g41094 [Rubroshorea leprosula]|uniref:Transposase (putative) gypsy type domain-containing protein n=1 Tax=Rubroshorea leprosula TaxID=152421 RepID=A0AAV5L5K1_9ROSI|nr:hypothetical protein SLEP1_g41094 [Rubroshorea leprosula]